MAEPMRQLRPSDDVLLIDDDADAATMYELGLSLFGHGAHVATTARQGLAEAEILPPDVIILDLNLRDLSGLEVLDRLRNHSATADVPVIVLSNDDEAIETAYRRGATECHRKYRTTPQQLVAYVEAYVAGSH
jgi:DNA-binding response OmpR family regulator